MRKLTAEMMAYLLNGTETGLDPLEPSRRTFPTGVIRHRNMTYGHGEKRDAVRHLLDLYLPPKEHWHSARPLIMFIHGGGWRIGSKDDLSGLYGRIAQIFAERGIAFATVNYRLSPRIKHPRHAEDVAAALAFLITEANNYGYAGDSVFLMGHSAGAHLAALLALNPRFLAAQQWQQPPDRFLRGVIALSGLYDLRGLAAFLPGELDDLGGAGGEAGETGEPQETPAGGAVTNHPLARAGIAFAPSDYADASPILQITAGAPSFLLIHEDQQVSPAMVAETGKFATALAAKAIPCTTIEMPATNHISMLIELARRPEIGIDPIVEFIHTQCRRQSTFNDPMR